MWVWHLGFLKGSGGFIVQFWLVEFEIWFGIEPLQNITKLELDRSNFKLIILPNLNFKPTPTQIWKNQISNSSEPELNYEPTRTLQKSQTPNSQIRFDPTLNCIIYSSKYTALSVNIQILFLIFIRFMN